MLMLDLLSFLASLKLNRATTVAPTKVCTDSVSEVLNGKLLQLYNTQSLSNPSEDNKQPYKAMAHFYSQIWWRTKTHLFQEFFQSHFSLGNKNNIFDNHLILLQVYIPHLSQV